MASPPTGNTICDYDPEEIKRQISISAAVAPVEYNGCKINVLDTPGNFDFAGEVAECLTRRRRGRSGLRRQGRPVRGHRSAPGATCDQQKMPRIVYISKMDEDNVRL